VDKLIIISIMSFPLHPKNANESMSESDTSSKKKLEGRNKMTNGGLLEMSLKLTVKHQSKK